MTTARPPALERRTAWTALVGVWLGLIAAGVYVTSVDSGLRQFEGRIIGHAVVFGIDPTVRVRAYVIICAITVGIAALATIALLRLQAWAAARGHVLLGRGERHGAALLALVGMSDLTLFVLTAAPAYLNGAAFLLLCMGLLAVGPLVRLLVRPGGWLPWMSPLGSALTQGAILLLAYQLSTGVGVLLELPLILGPATLGRLVLTWLVLQAVVLAVSLRPASGPDARFAGWRLLRAGVPLLWLPALGPVANELQFTLRTSTTWTPQTLAAAMAAGVAAVAVGIWRRTPRQAVPAGTALRLLRRWYVPVVVISSAMLTLHRQTMTVEAVDAYHHGEMLTPVLQILQDGRIPYLEICLPHGLMDVVPQIFFGALNGADRWDILIWGSGHWAGWLTLTVGVALVYALLATVASPLAAILVLLFLPAEPLFSSMHAPLIICVLALHALVRHGGARRAWMLPVSVLAMCLWRVDFGVATLAASVAVLLVVAWSCRRMRWRPLVVASGVLLAGTGALATALSILRGVSLTDALHKFLAYVSMQVMVASYASVYDTMSPMVVLQYLLLPAIGLLIVLLSGVRALLVRQCGSPLAHGVLFLAIVSLVLFVRSLQRHSLFEGVFSPHLFLFLLAALPALRHPPRRTLVSFLVVLVSVTAAFVVPDGRLPANEVKWPAIAGGPAHFAFRTWSAADQRVLVNDAATEDVVRLLRAQLQPGQTFYDFANAPLLYFLTGAPLPTYGFETGYHSSEAIQHGVIRDLDALRRAGRLPLVVFKQNTGFDAIDGIRNEVRSYRIAEYLYAYYRPWANAGRFELWIDKTLAAPAFRLETGLEGPAVRRYPLPLQAPTASANVRASALDAGGLALAPLGEPAWVDGMFRLPAHVAWAAGAEYHLHLRYIASAAGILEARFSFAGPTGTADSRAEVMVVTTSRDVPAGVSLPLRLGREAPATVTGIRLVLPRAATFTIVAAELEVRQRPVEATPAWAWSPVEDPYVQHFDLFRLPYVWASFDDGDPVHTSAALQTLHAGGPVELGPGWDQGFTVQPAGAPDGQYLHLRLQADTPGTVTVAYGAGQHPSTFSLLVPATAAPQDHLIRLSTQWEWFRGGVTALRVSSTAPVMMHSLRILAGD